ncbi:hypothetical protein QMO56_09225 [Roseomonas sp. E05]|uniref:hypothetical protein n=1 Tax=Roseomonas sp. E05 TaxID=3046310 RepID=UPI0024BA6038|nr:hypothetical protein [Roseomonas sp. E05]MDJ0388294.1 hypothetical protein [Roseomonas sp. E05]
MPRLTYVMGNSLEPGAAIAKDLDALLASVPPLFAEGISTFVYEVVELEMVELAAARARATAWLERARERGDGSSAACIATIAALDARQARVAEGLRNLWRLQAYLERRRDYIAPPSSVSSRSKPDSKNTRVRDRVAAVLAEGGPTHRTELLKVVLADGLLGAEQRPMNRLASILASNGHLFGSDSRGTYFLLSTEPKEQTRSRGRAGLPTGRRPALPTSQPEKGGEGHAGACAV